MRPIRKTQEKPRRRVVLPGYKDVGLSRYPSSIDDTVERLRQRRQEVTGVKPPKTIIYREGMELYLTMIDWQTALPRQVIPSITAIGDWPIFGQEYGDFADLDDPALFAQMDEEPMMVWTCNADLINLHVNPRLVDYTGRTAAEFAGEGWTDLIHPDDRVKLWQIFETFRTHVAPFHSLYWRMRRKDGAYGVMLDYARPRRRNGVFAGYVGTTYEIAAQPQELQRKLVLPAT